jgi:hypothetical protein
MNPNFDHSKYFVSMLTKNGERPDISPNFKYLEQFEIDYCKWKIAVKIVELNFARDKIITSIRNARATTSNARMCLQTRGDKTTREIRTLEIKFDELSISNFPIFRLSRKTRIGRIVLPEGVTVYLTKFQKKESTPHTPEEPDLLAEETDGISPIPRVTEEIKWRPTVETEADTSIFDSVDEFIRLPVDDIIKRLQEEQKTGTPDLRNRARFLDQLWRKDLSPEFDWNNYYAELNEATGFRGWDSDDDTLSTFNLDLIYPYQDDSDDDTLSTFNLDLLFPYQDEAMALTQAAIDTLQITGQNNTAALVTGMRTLATQKKLENIQIFLGESNCPLVK